MHVISCAKLLIHLNGYCKYILGEYMYIKWLFNSRGERRDGGGEHIYVYITTSTTCYKGGISLYK